MGLVYMSAWWSACTWWAEALVSVLYDPIIPERQLFGILVRKYLEYRTLFQRRKKNVMTMHMFSRMTLQLFTQAGPTAPPKHTARTTKAAQSGRFMETQPLIASTPSHTTSWPGNLTSALSLLLNLNPGTPCPTAPKPEWLQWFKKAMHFQGHLEIGTGCWPCTWHPDAKNKYKVTSLIDCIFQSITGEWWILWNYFLWWDNMK